MKKIIVVCIILLFISIPIVNSVKGFSGTVIDDETKKPIEGADVFARWTITKGMIGLSHEETYKVVEIITDNNGKFSILGPLRPTNSPTLVIYKKGYVAWNNEYIFPYDEKRKDWGYGSKVRLKKFTPDYTHYGSQYTHYGHMSFLDQSSLLGSEGDKIRKASEWERALARKEQDKNVDVNLKCKVVDSETGVPIEGAIGWLYLNNKMIDIKVVSDKEGNITINGYFPLVYHPSFSIVKEGYWDWSLGYDHKWEELEDGYIFKLNKKNK